MDPRSSNRQKVTTGESKGVHRRGEGLGTGPVGRQDGYVGRKTGSSGGGNRAAQIGGGSGALVVIIIILFALFGGGGSSDTANTGVNTNNTQGTNSSTSNTSGDNSSINVGGSNNSSSSSSSSSSSAGSTGAQSFGDITSLFGGFSGGATTTGWQNGFNNTSKLNSDVSPLAREKRTQILGNGQDTVTIMIYDCGTDLESRSGMATNDINEIAQATIPDNVNIIVYTGGCNGWKTNGISNKVNQIYKITSGKMEQLVEDDGDKVMTDPNTLVSFIDFCAENFPANRQNLIFWDHGGGSLSGYGYDEKHKSSGSMTLPQIDQALKATQQKFDFIGFDACLMATYETAIMTSKYADYLIASEETEPGIGWYYTKWVNALGQNTSMPTLEIGKNIVDGFVEECNRVCGGQKTTLSIIDLSEFSETVPEKMSAFSSSATNLIKGSDFKQVSDARAGSREFAVSSKIDQIDLVNFANTIGNSESKELTEAILSAVKYNRTSNSMTNAYGVSIYFPYKKASRVDSATAINSAIGVDSEYNTCIKAFAGLETTGQISAGGQGSALGSLFGTSSGGTTSGGDAIGTLLNAFLSGGRSVDGIERDATQFMDDESAFDVEQASQYVGNNQFDPSQLVWTEEDGQHLLDMPKEQWQLIQNLQVNMFVDDGEGYIDMGLDNLYNFTEDGKLIGDTDNTWFSIDHQPVAFYYEDTTTVDDGGENTIVQGRVPAFVDGVRCNLIIIFDNDHPNGYIAGARYDYKDEVAEFGAQDTSDMPVAKATEIAEGAKIDFLCDFYDYDGNYQDSYKIGDEWTYSSIATLSYEDVGAKSKITYMLTDIYNSEYWTPSIEQ